MECCSYQFALFSDLLIKICLFFLITRCHLPFLGPNQRTPKRTKHPNMVCPSSLLVVVFILLFWHFVDHFVKIDYIFHNYFQSIKSKIIYKLFLCIHRTAFPSRPIFVHKFPLFFLMFFLHCYFVIIHVVTMSYCYFACIFFHIDRNSKIAIPHAHT